MSSSNRNNLKQQINKQTVRWISCTKSIRKYKERNETISTTASRHNWIIESEDQNQYIRNVIEKSLFYSPAVWL